LKEGLGKHLITVSLSPEQYFYFSSELLWCCTRCKNLWLFLVCYIWLLDSGPAGPKHVADIL